jgi:hypothetical protein
MSKFLRLAAGLLGVGVLGLAVVYLDPASLHTSTAPWDPKRRDSMAEELLRREHLKQLHEVTFRRIEAKWQVAKEVIARRRTLAEAIEQYRDLDRQWPDIRARAERHELVWMSEDEWDGRSVIDQVRQVLAQRPDEAAAVAGRLEKELQ